MNGPSLSIILLAAAGLAHAGVPLEVTGAWVAEAPPGARAQAAYMTVRNVGGAPQALVAASSPACAVVELHRTVDDGTVSRMEKVPRLSIAPGEVATFAPGGLHLMLIDPRDRLAAGSVVPIELRLESGASIGVDARVRRLEPAAGADHRHSHH